MSDDYDIDDAPVGGEEESSEPIYLNAGARQPTMEAGPLETDNLAVFYTEEELKKLASKSLDNYEEDVSSRSGRMKKLKEFTEAYAMLAKPKSFPFQNAANVMTPLLTGPKLQVHARLYDMIWPIGGRIVHTIPATASDAPVAHLTEKFANAYIRYRMPEMAQGLDDTLHQLCLYGSAFRRTYWDASEGRVRSDWIPIEDFVVAHWRRSQDPSMRDVPRYTLVHHMTIYDLEDHADKGIFVNVEKVKASIHEMERGESSDLEEVVKKVDGSEEAAGGSDEDRPRKVLELHCKWRLPKRPGHPAFDGRVHPVVITIDGPSEQILRIALREEDDPDDLKRFNREMETLSQYQSDLVVYQAGLEQYSMALQSGIDPVMMGLPEPGAPPEAPPEPKPVRKREICFFTHYRAFPSEGFYGLGYGDMLYGLAKAANTIINQHIDGVTLRNAKPGFISRNLRMQRGTTNVQPGELMEVDAPASVIRDAIYFLDPPDNDPSTVPLIEMFKGFADQIAGSSDIMSGQIPGSNQTKAGMQILADQAMAPITVLARRVSEAFRHELDKIWRCWGVFLDDEDIADIINEDGQPEQIPIGRMMFSPTAKIIPASDPRIKSVRVEEAQGALTAALQNPFLQSHPNAPIIYSTLSADFFRAIGAEKIVPMIMQPFTQPNGQNEQSGQQASPSGPPPGGDPPMDGAPPDEGVPSEPPGPMGGIPNGGPPPPFGQ